MVHITSRFVNAGCMTKRGDGFRLDFSVVERPSERFGADWAQVIMTAVVRAR
jgi:hypothetical protein